MLCVVQSCSSFERYDEKRDLRLSKHFPKGYGIVIVKINAEQKNSEGTVVNKGFSEMNWRRYSDNLKCRETEYSRFSLQILNSDDSEDPCKKTLFLNPYRKKKITSTEYEAYIAEEGMYFLQRIRDVPIGWFTEDFLLSLTFKGIIGHSSGYKSYSFANIKPGWNNNLNEPNFASFEVSAGEIVYIGDLDFTFTRSSKRFLKPYKAKINLTVIDNFSIAKKYFYENFTEFKDVRIVRRLAKRGVLLNDYEAGMIFYQ